MKKIILGIAIASSLLLSACGGDSDDTTSGTGTGTGTAQAQAQQTVLKV